ALLGHVSCKRAASATICLVLPLNALLKLAKRNWICAGPIRTGARSNGDGYGPSSNQVAVAVIWRKKGTISERVYRTAPACVRDSPDGNPGSDYAGCAAFEPVDED